MKRIFVICLTIVLFFCLPACGSKANSHGNGASVYDDPDAMSDTAFSFIFGWKDIDEFMQITPYKEGTQLYANAYEEFNSLMQTSDFIDKCSRAGIIDVDRTDPDFFNQTVSAFSQIGLGNLTAMRQYVYNVSETDDEIVIYVGKIDGKWYTLLCEYY